ncbi:hypothetical protein B0J14DRAFT_635667 [Halenospora varia]|nr:hypothetical protein B0J14DRAFT_635667 [Halenospora varia]
MVYGGKLSKACEPCRARRAKCDLSYPDCSQCIRAKRPCHGYRDTEGLRITDMSTIVINKCRAKNPPKPGSFPRERLHKRTQSDTPPFNPSIVTFSLLTTRGPSVFIDDRAFCYFHTTFVTGQSRSFKYLEAIYASTSTHLSTSILAVGLASLSRAVRSYDIEIRARKAYASALQLVNTTLGTTQATDDATLSTVMLLDQFEKIIPPPNRSTSALTNHLNGASALMKMRGPGQFQTKTGLEMFIHMSSHLLVNCMQHEIPLPQDYLNLRTYATNFFDTSDISWRLSQVTVEYIAFRVAIKEGRLFDPETIIRATSEMDEQMAGLLGDIPPFWRYQSVPIDHPTDLVFGEHYDLYVDYRVLEALNMIRAGRFPLFELIREQAGLSLEPLSLECEMMVLQASENQEETVGLICACVPQQAGYLSDNEDALSARYSPEPEFELSGSTSTASSSPSSSTESSSPKFCTPRSLRLNSSHASSAYSLIWPLFTAANSSYTAPEARGWIIRQLRTIGISLGLEKALEVVTLLEGERRGDIWKVYEMLGSICYSANG